MTTELYIGLISGTSMDGIDAALVEVRATSCQLLATHSRSWPEAIRVELARVIKDRDQALQSAHSDLNHQLGLEFARAAMELLDAASVPASAVTAIGSHGQTVWHAPDEDPPFSLQIGCPETIASETGIAVIADFRSADLESGGQGAPLAPAFHQWMFACAGADRAVVNIGGIANVTLLHADGTTTGFDTGPGNNLMDGWIREHQQVAFDDNGAWAAGGSVDTTLLSLLADDAYFSRPPPKSTGFEYFNQDWLRQSLQQMPTAPNPRNVQSTLCELTVMQIVAGCSAMKHIEQLAVCGGGAANRELMARLQHRLPETDVMTTAAWGIDPDWVEAVAFAWLARQRQHSLPSNLPAVTGASAQISLGRQFLPS